MKAFQIQGGFGLENLKRVELPEPDPPGPGEVLLSVKAISLNYRDLLVVQGRYNPKQPLPLVPGSDAAAEVLDVGPQVHRFQIGDRVCPIFCQNWLEGPPSRKKLRSSLGTPLQGTFSERFKLNEEGLVRFPDHLSFVEAATLPCAAVTAWNAVVVEGGVGEGQNVLVQGGGGVSLFALQFAKALNCRVFATSSTEARRRRLQELGADEGLMRVEGWGKRLKELTGGDGVHLVVEVGGGESLAESLRAVAIGGTVVLIGVVAGTEARLQLTSILMRNLRLQGIVVGSRAIFEDMNKAIERKELRPVIDRVYPFEKLPEALQYLRTGKHFGKICLQLD